MPGFVPSANPDGNIHSFSKADALHSTISPDTDGEVLDVVRRQEG